MSRFFMNGIELHDLEEIKMLIPNFIQRDPYTAGHSDRVTKLSLEIGSIIGLPNSKLETLEIAALCDIPELLDTGKLV